MLASFINKIFSQSRLLVEMLMDREFDYSEGYLPDNHLQ